MCYMLVYDKCVTISSILLSFIRYFVEIVLFDPRVRRGWGGGGVGWGGCGGGCGGGVCCFLMSYNCFLYASVINEIEIRSDSLRFHIKILYFTRFIKEIQFCTFGGLFGNDPCLTPKPQT